jgi:hypothetical protein
MSDITNVSDNQLRQFRLFVVVMGGGVQSVFCDAGTVPELFKVTGNGP